MGAVEWKMFDPVSTLETLLALATGESLGQHGRMMCIACMEIRSLCLGLRPYYSFHGIL